MIDRIVEMEKAVEKASSEPGKAVEDLMWLLSTSTWEMIPAEVINKAIAEEFDEEVLDFFEALAYEVDDEDYPIIVEILHIGEENYIGE